MNAPGAYCEIREVFAWCDDLRLASSWIHAEWGHREGETLEETQRWCTAVAQNQAEAFFVARAGGETLGCGALVLNDLPVRKELSPWGACLYVRPQHREAQVGSALMARIRDTAIAMGHRWLHLWTDTERLVETYQRKGFVELDRLVYAARPIVILRLRLGG